MLKQHRPRRQRGLSVVELLVGVAVGLFVVAAAALVVGGQLSSNRKLLLDTQLQQDLRAAAEFVCRELRRAGAMSDPQSIDRIWRPTSPTAPGINFYGSNLAPSSGTASSLTYQYNRNGTTQFGFDLYNGRIRTRLEGNYQDVTDPNVMKVTTFSLTVRNAASVQLVCPLACSGGGTACWPTVQVRDIDIDIRAEAANDPSVVRSIRTTVKLRNDLVRRDASLPPGYCPTT